MNYVLSPVARTAESSALSSGVLVCEPDLLFSSGIESAARRHGFDVKLTTTPADLVESLNEKTPSVVIMNLDVICPLSVISGLTGKQGCRFVGYYSHVNARVAEEAKRAGFETVLPRRAFVSKLNGILEMVKLGG
jgi:DNA-binding NarL/FixJ family response regulator